MPVTCDVCGIEALESEEFALERIPFRRARRYCPACHRRFYFRIYGALMAVPILFGIAGLVQLWRGDNPLAQTGARWSALIMMQWLMVVPHELGHALAGRWLGYKDIRILIGFGKPLVSFQLLGFRWLLNLIPLGGLTLHAPANPFHRWKHFAVIAAGPLVNLLAAVMAIVLTGAGWMSQGLGTWQSLFIWGNLLVLAENLVPYVAQTHAGAKGTDGYQMWHLLFGWNRPVRLEPQKVPLWELVLCYGLKSLALLVTGGTTLALAACAVYVWLRPIGSYGHKSDTGLALLLLALSVMVGWVALRIADNPVAKVRARGPDGPRATQFTPEQIDYIKKAQEEYSRKDFAAVEKTYDALLGVLTDRNSYAFAVVFRAKTVAQIEQGHIEKAEAACLAYAQEPVNKEHKIQLLDQVASTLLYQRSSPWLKQAETLVRLALDLAPGTLTLKGTLGGILVELDDYAAAEPLLRECLELSPELHDQGISSVYLGFIRLHEGKLEEGKRLIEHGRTLYTAEWLEEKIKMRLSV